MKPPLPRIKDKERKNNTQATKNKERGDDNDYGKEKCYATHDENPDLDGIVVKMGQSLSYAADDHRFLWPIPKTEMDSNPNLAGQQNPGY